ncbi:MAG: redox-sensing transcriptional repressor Rex [Candidatus Gastranaerophilales bacterium]|nr:redox-sensing transcriptional repressor Rex [Candidatus Gastranaerophilales bacterium]
MKHELSQRTINRLTQYHTILREYSKKDVINITSAQISNFLKIDETQVRKDLKSIDCKGKCKVGYVVAELKEAIENVLDYKTTKKAFVIGAGNLGIALSKYSKFSEFGLEILGLFDIDESKIGQKFDNKEIYHLSKLKEKIQETGVNIAILTLPNKVAQNVADEITKVGIKYIWNFAPSILTLPDDVKVWNENLIGSFLQFCAIESIK